MPVLTITFPAFFKAQGPICRTSCLNFCYLQLVFSLGKILMAHSAVATALEKVSFHSNPKGNAKECSNYHNCTHLTCQQSNAQNSPSQASAIHELPNVQAGFRKGRGVRDQIANICWIIKKAREFQKNINFCFIDYAKAFDCVDHNKLWNILRDGNTRPPDLPLEKPICKSGSNSQNWTWNNRLVPNRKRSMSRLYIVTLLI